jgi:peptidoglycan/xylan/chitin deacetylase (PgdA/CDA1 family)
VMNGEDRRYDCESTEAKYELYEHIYWWLRSLDSEDDLRRAVRDLGTRYGVDSAAFCNDLCMTWAEIGAIAAGPLATIGAHTVNHVMLRKASDAVVRGEMQQSVAVIAAALGRKPEHFSYPVGDRTSAGPREFRIAAELGFKTAVTTRPGVLFPEHAAHLTALPRISLNGEYQQRRYAKVLLSGAATGLWNGFRRVDAA